MLYFASAASFTGKAYEDLQAPSTARKLFNELELKYPGIGAKVLQTSALTINLDYVDIGDAVSSSAIQAGDEVAIIPPVSAG